MNSPGSQLRVRNQHRRQQRQRQFVMSRDRKPLSRAVRGRPPNDICRGPVALNEIEICGRDVAQLVTEISDDGDRL